MKPHESISSQFRRTTEGRRSGASDADRVPVMPSSKRVKAPRASEQERLTTGETAAAPSCSAEPQPQQARASAAAALAGASQSSSTESDDWTGSLVAPIRSWAWRALETARGELRLAMDSVVEDMEAVSEALSSHTMVGEATSSHRSAGGAVSSESAHDEESTRVDDFFTPAVVRLEYEQEDYIAPPQRCDGFEVNDCP